MKYVVLDKFTNFLSVDENSNTLEVNSIEEANNEASNCQNGLVIPLNTDRLFTKAQVLDVLVSFAQSMYPEEFNSSKELTPEDFMDAPLCKADELSLTDEFEKAIKIYSNASEDFINNYKPENLL